MHKVGDLAVNISRQKDKECCSFTELLSSAQTLNKSGLLEGIK